MAQKHGNFGYPLGRKTYVKFKADAAGELKAVSICQFVDEFEIEGVYLDRKQWIKLQFLVLNHKHQNLS